MKVILLNNIEKLGKKGDVVNVKRGYARNYLVPREMAIYATPQNMKKVDSLKLKAVEEEEIRLAALKKLAETINTVNLVFIRKVDENDTMFGSVSEADIVSALAEKGLEIQKSAVQLEKHIKELGQSQIQLKLHKDISATLSIDIRKEETEIAAEPAVEPVQPEPVLAEPAPAAEAADETQTTQTEE